MQEKQRFEDYLRMVRPAKAEELMQQFESYHAILQEINQVVNLISRKTDAATIWTKHFLDSIRLIECLDLKGKVVLDFGSGGGLPGIPLQLLEPSASIDLLDSIAKKTQALATICQSLGLNDTAIIRARLEDYALKKDRREYDLVICRAVSLEERFLKPLRLLLKPGGMLVLYKSHNLEDIRPFRTDLLAEYEDLDLGKRSFYAINRDALVMPRQKKNLNKTKG